MNVPFWGLCHSRALFLHAVHAFLSCSSADKQLKNTPSKCELKWTIPSFEVLLTVVLVNCAQNRLKIAKRCVIHTKHRSHSRVLFGVVTVIKDDSKLGTYCTGSVKQQVKRRGYKTTIRLDFFFFFFFREEFAVCLFVGYA